VNGGWPAVAPCGVAGGPIQFAVAFGDGGALQVALGEAQVEQDLPFADLGMPYDASGCGVCVAAQCRDVGELLVLVRE
jgi:hypothetical protein